MRSLSGRAWLRRAGVWIFVLALLVRIGLIFLLGTYRSIERTEVVNVGISLAQKGQFADAYGPGTGPTAHTAPAYPLLLSIIFRILGTGTAAEIVQEIFSSTIASITCALLPSLAVAFGMSRLIGVWAGAWLAVLPINFWAETKGSFESALCAFALVICCWYCATVWRRGRFSLREACTGGAIGGFALLISPSVLSVIVLLLAVGIWLFPGKRSMCIRYAAAFSCVAFVLLVPWALRNTYALGSPILTRSNLWLELAGSNNEYAHADRAQDIEDLRAYRYHPFLNEHARAEELRVGEVAYMRELKSEAIAWISSHPGRFLQLTVERFALFWFPRMERISQTILIRLESIAGIAGFILFWRTSLSARWIFAAVWAGYPTLYYLVHAFARYRYPIDWTFVLLGSFAVWWLYHGSSASRNHTEIGTSSMAARPGSRGSELSGTETPRH